MSFLKDAWRIFLAWLFIMLIVVMAVDAYEYERTSRCDGCVILKGWYER